MYLLSPRPTCNAGRSLMTFCPQTYWNLIESIPPEKIRLTRLDHEIWEHMTRDFPEYFEDPKKLEVLEEDVMKDVKGKERWRNFIQV